MAQYALFDETMLTRTKARRTLEKELRHALVLDQLVLTYEPIVALRNPGETIAGFQASVSWQHPERGLLDACVFISVAEDARSVVEIDRWTLATAARALAAWQREARFSAGLSVSVRISTTHFALDNVAEYVCSVAAENGLPPATLHLEIDETALSDDAERLAKGLAEVRRCGAEIHVRGFGTGRSALVNLRRFSVNTLKIDRSFVTTMLDDPISADLVRTIVVLARSLNLRAIAEGVASTEQVERLRELGCDFAQGPNF